VIVVPRKLMDLIAALPRLGPLVFSEDGVTPDYYLLKDLKRIAAQAGLDPDDCWHRSKPLFTPLTITGCTQTVEIRGGPAGSSPRSYKSAPASGLATT
jgi:hypothetical protein